MFPRKRDAKASHPKLLRARMEKARDEEGHKMDLEYEEVTGVIDMALARGREVTEENIAKVKNLVDRMDKAFPKPEPT